jgi:asparagine synthase (glutamine-hydrolysing)
MCGLAGRFHPRSLTAAEAWCRQADRLLWHRGPDSAGAFRDGRCELVHRRLALIDLSPTGHQPLANEDGTVLIVYNGEVYNHPELRQELVARGHQFRGSSDTEVLVHLYEEAGPAMVDRLRGIFAFAIYDQRHGRLLLARDRFGVKPLFWARHGDEWVFASEMKAILALPGFRPELDRQACFDYLGLSYVPEPATGFANIHALPAGTTLRIDGDGHRFTQYFHAKAHANGDASVTDVADRVSAALLDAAHRQSVADVPVAALLSGGIDSSLVVAAHARSTRTTTTTFNVRFPEFDETERAVAVAAHYATRHNTIDLGDRELTSEGIIDLMRHFDQPFADTSLVPMYWVSQAVRERGIVCTLSGDGGDEAFGGYPSFWRLTRLVQLMGLPAWSRRLLSATARRVTPFAPDIGRPLQKAVQLAEIGRGRPASLLAGLIKYLSDAERDALIEADAWAGLAPTWRLFDGVPDGERGLRSLEALSERLTDVHFSVSLPSQMLRKVDMMSMRASIEVRVPMLDEQVVAHGLSIKHGLKTDGRRGKLVLRTLADRWLPPAVASGRKQGFNIPIDVMVPPGFHDLLHDLLLSDGARTRGLLNRPLLTSWLTAFKSPGRGDHLGTISRWGLYQRVFAALALEQWLRDYSLTW